MKFEELSLCPALLRSLQEAGYEEATPIQQTAIPPVLQGRDLIGCAQTGTGKTAAFALPILQQLMQSPEAPTGADRRRQRTGRRIIRALILAPTRELAGQIGDSLATYGRYAGLRHAVIFGGVRQDPQVRALRAGIDILVATPGRLLDLVGQGHVDLSTVEILILDEADRMLDMGFINDLNKIVDQIPNRRQTLMFSATMAKEIRVLAARWLRRPAEVQVAAAASTPDRVAQAVYFVERNDKAATLTRFLLETPRSRTLVFSRTKRGADRIVRFLNRDGIRAIAIHGDKSQSMRQAAIRDFNSKRPPVLVATDLAARGLDFSDVSHVINFDMPDAPETYIHRIGRTARAGASGQAVSFCGHDERKLLRMIERLIGRTVSVEKLPPRSEHVRTRAGATETSDVPAPDKDVAPATRPAGFKPAGQGSGRSWYGKSSTGSGGARNRFGKDSRSRQKRRPRVAGSRQ
jgi:ATP-dependent RNA helicase RhlE